VEGTESPLVIGVPGDRDVDIRRLEAAVHPLAARPFEEADFAKFPGLVKGYIGPQALGEARGLRYLVDPRVVIGTRWITGANQVGHHVFDLVCGRDFTPDGVIDVAEIVGGDPCPECGSAVTIARGIEIGHIFQLGRKYAEALDLEVLDETGTRITVTMGSYGIGVSRAVAAIAEQHHDDKGLVWPREVAPADVHIVVAGKDDDAYEFADGLATDLDDLGVRILIDDRRGVSPGVKFNDSELLGIPTIVVVGKGLAAGVVEVKDRRTGDRTDVATSDISEYLRGLVLAS